MPGPVSMPVGTRAQWEELNEIVCHYHRHCDMAEFDKHGKPVVHEYITYREWLARRGRLSTGKTFVNL